MSLKEAFAPYFKMGVAVARPDITNASNIELIRKEYNIENFSLIKDELENLLKKLG